MLSEASRDRKQHLNVGVETAYTREQPRRDCRAAAAGQRRTLPSSRLPTREEELKKNHEHDATDTLPGSTEELQLKIKPAETTGQG